MHSERFGTIRNNTALKHETQKSDDTDSFGTIRNNTALKRGTSSNGETEVLEPFETTQL